jgi:hypothetical protein
MRLQKKPSEARSIFAPKFGDKISRGLPVAVSNISAMKHRIYIE